MSEIRKVLGELILTARRYRDYIRPVDPSFSDELNEQVKSATAIYESLPADGELGGSEVVYQCKWSPENEAHGEWAYCSKEWRDQYIGSKNWKFRELIVKPADPLDSPDQRAITDQWESGELGRSAEHARVVPGSRPAPPTVPADVMEAAEKMAARHAYSSHPDGRDSEIVLRWLKSLGGAR